jgi:hypothetical protein
VLTRPFLVVFSFICNETGAGPAGCDLVEGLIRRGGVPGVDRPATPDEDAVHRLGEPMEDYLTEQRGALLQVSRAPSFPAPLPSRQDLPSSRPERQPSPSPPVASAGNSECPFRGHTPPGERRCPALERSSRRAIPEGEDPFSSILYPFLLLDGPIEGDRGDAPGEGRGWTRITLQAEEGGPTSVFVVRHGTSGALVREYPERIRWASPMAVPLQAPPLSYRRSPNAEFPNNPILLLSQDWQRLLTRMFIGMRRAAYFATSHMTSPPDELGGLLVW